MKDKIKKGDMGGLLALLLFAVFAICILSVLLTGANTYKDLTDSSSANNSGRTAMQYIATKVRQGDQEGALSASSFDGDISGTEGDTLFISEEIDGTGFNTRIYCYDGYLCELFGLADGSFTPESGEKILAADAVHFELSDKGLLQVELTDTKGDLRSVSLSLRSGKVVD